MLINNHEEFDPIQFRKDGDEIDDADNACDHEEFDLTKFHEDGEGFDDAYIHFDYHSNRDNEGFDDIGCNYCHNSNEEPNGMIFLCQQKLSWSPRSLPLYREIQKDCS